MSDHDHLTPEQRALAQYMSDLSEAAYCAGWMSGLEVALFTAQVGQRYGLLTFTAEHIAELARLSQAAGGWIAWVDGRERFVPRDEWTARLAAAVGQVTRDVRDRAQATTIVHILDGGVALCGLPGVPGDWGLGQRWVHAAEANHPAVNCAACKRAHATGEVPQLPALPSIYSRDDVPAMPSSAALITLVRAAFAWRGQGALSRWTTGPSVTLAKLLDRFASDYPEWVERFVPEHKADTGALPAVRYARTIALLQRLVAAWNATENDPRGERVDMDLLRQVADSFEAETALHGSDAQLQHAATDLLLARYMVAHPTVMPSEVKVLDLMRWSADHGGSE